MKKTLIGTILVSASLGAALLLGGGTTQATTLTFAERDEIIALYNYELSKLGPVTLTGVTKDNLFQKLNEKVLVRTETKDVTIKEKVIKQKDYTKYRLDLLTKAVSK